MGVCLGFYDVGKYNRGDVGGVSKVNDGVIRSFGRNFEGIWGVSGFCEGVF